MIRDCRTPDSDARAAGEGWRIEGEAPVIRAQRDDASRSLLAYGYASVALRQTVRCQIGVIDRVQSRRLSRKAVDERIVRGFGSRGCRRAGRSGYLCMVRFESPIDRHDCVVYGNLDNCVVKEAHCAAMSGTSVYDRLYSDRIPIRYGIGSYD